MSKSKLTNTRFIDNQVIIDVEVFGIRKHNQTPQWFYAGKIVKDGDLITATDRRGTTNLFKVTDQKISYTAAQEWLEVREFIAGTLLLNAYDYMELIGDIKQRSPIELVAIISTLPSYIHNQFMAMCKQELSPDDYKIFMSAIEKNKYYLNSNEYILSQSVNAIADLGF